MRAYDRAQQNEQSVYAALFPKAMVLERAFARAGGLLLASTDPTAAGGVVNGPVIKPGNAAGSYLYQAVAGTQKVGARMPANGKVLPTTDIKNIYNWIQSGAKGP